MLDVLAPMHCKLVIPLSCLSPQGQLYLKKATVLDVLAPMHGEIVVDDTGRHVNVMQQELETYVPKAPGTRVRAIACSSAA